MADRVASQHTGKSNLLSIDKRVKALVKEYTVTEAVRMLVLGFLKKIRRVKRG